jgi:hypothetical protein
MKLVIRPVQDAPRELDISYRRVSAIAVRLWRRCGGNEQLNWIEAERHLQRRVAGTRSALKSA